MKDKIINGGLFAAIVLLLGFDIGANAPRLFIGPQATQKRDAYERRRRIVSGFVAGVTFVLGRTLNRRVLHS